MTQETTESSVEQLVDETNVDGVDTSTEDPTTVESTDEEKAAEAAKEQEEHLSRRQRAEARRQAELQALREKVAALEQASRPTTTRSAPNIADYDGRPIDEYMRDHISFLEEQLVEKTREETRAAMRAERVKAEFEAKTLAARKEFADWDQVMLDSKDDGIDAQSDTVEFILDSDIGPKIAYYLAKHPGEHEKINSMSHTRRLAALGKIEDKLTAAPAPVTQTKRVTSAPAKLSDTKGSSAPVTLDPASAARQGYAAWKAADEARRASKK